MKLFLIFTLTFFTTTGFASENLSVSLKRAQYLLNSSFPSDSAYKNSALNKASYNNAIRKFIDNESFYQAVLRYHERMLGVGLPTEYLDEIIREDIDNRENKFAKIQCGPDAEDRLNCHWVSSDEDIKSTNCPKSWEQSVAIFWYPGVTAWVCPSVINVCGSDLSQCFIEYEDRDVAKNSELGTTIAFDSRFSVVKSLSKQPAGIATAVAIANYPYTKILEPGLTAIDGAIAHFYQQKHHFDLQKIHIPDAVQNIVKDISLTDTKFRLIFTGETYEHAGIISTFGWLRRYEKNRTRANQLYERLLCKKFTAELPRVFPQDPGNLRETPGCSGCHSSLDPLADFFLSWGEGGDLYTGGKTAVTTKFNNHEGDSLADLARIIQSDEAFPTCTTENVWKWLMGRGFYKEEAELRAGLANYFIKTNYSFKELVYAIATHPAFTEGSRSDGVVSDPIDEPALGEIPDSIENKECDKIIDYNADLKSDVQSQCGVCHNANSSSREDLTTEDQLNKWSSQVVNMMTSGNMPPGQAGPPLVGPIYDLKEKIRCWKEQ